VRLICIHWQDPLLWSAITVGDEQAILSLAERGQWFKILHNSQGWLIARQREEAIYHCGLRASPRSRSLRGSDFHGFAGKDFELLWSIGVLEYWSVGKSESPNFNLNESFHYSIIPSLQQTAA
jgi:hypothetical protein